MTRAIDIYLCDFDEHIDLSGLDTSMVQVEKTNKGSSTPSGQKFPYNVVVLRCSGFDLPDDYDFRIQSLISALGGEEVVRKIISEHRARISAVTMGIPTRTGDTIEDGYISCETMKKLCDLGLELHFYYT